MQDARFATGALGSVMTRESLRPHRANDAGNVPRQGKGRASYAARWVGRLGPGLLMGLLLLTPLLVLGLHGLSIVGMTEESSGYRYFYSLRYLYTSDEHPWVPQGQSMTLIHMAIQMILTALGIPPTQLQPRLDLFVWIAAILPHLATAAALAWAVAPIRGVLGRVAIVGAFVVVAVNGTMTWDRHLILPDYYSWIHTLALVSLGCCLRMTAEDWRPSWRWAVGLGVLAGIAIGLKITLALLMVAPGLLWLRQRSWRLLTAGSILAGAVAVVSFGGIILAAHAFDLRATKQLFVLMLTFDAVEGHAENTPIFVRMVQALGGHQSVVVRLEHVALLVQIAGLVLLRRRLLSAITVVSTLLPLLLLAVRDTPTTLVEIGDGVLIGTLLWAVRVGAPAAQTWLRRCLASAETASRVGLVAQATICILLLASAARGLTSTSAYYLEQTRIANDVERRIDAFVAERPGRVAIVTVSNEYHPYTRDSAIFKGGTNISQTSLWGASRLVRDIVPERLYVYPDPRLKTPVDLAAYDYLLFVSRQPPELIGATRASIQGMSGIAMTGFECPLVMPNPESQGLQYACRRTADAPANSYTGEIAYVEKSIEVLPKFQAFRGDGQRQPLEVGEAVYSGDTRELWRLNEDWSFTRLRGAPGEQREVPGIGEWSPEERETVGMTVTFDGVHWQLPSDGLAALNANPKANLDESNRLDGWELLSPQATRISEVPDRADPSADPWVQLRLTMPGARVGARSLVPIEPDIEGAPIGAILSVKDHGEGGASVRMHALNGDTPGPEARSTLQIGQDGRLTYHLRLEPEQIVGSVIELLIEQAGAGPGAGIDIQWAEIYAGRAP